ncbi:hypothetical protein SDC9_16518 [bioreactor metagenome]|uniref:LicD/FKTN/FKRP nucleotidyltransferase domain-containing protein n=1 Tax=bioreactor metagenome TaxID=1076179 RepID=A0A644TWF1_9ZZZZ
MGTILNEIIPYPYSEFQNYETKYDLKEKHDEILGLLLIFDKFCRENDIKYSLADGTLLGAIRHGDFIPWDDDVDLMVTRDEYKKLRKVLSLNSEIRLLKIHFLDRITAQGYDNKHIYLDLFINEEMPANKFIFKLKVFETKFLRTYFRNTKVRNVRHDGYSNNHKIIRNMVSTVLCFFAIIIVGKRDVFEINDRAVALNHHRPSGIYTRYTSRIYETKRRFNKSSYDYGYCDVLFRGHRLMSIINADTFLREMYGDYFILVPEEKRKPEHPVNMMDSPSSCIKWYN